MKLQIQKLKTTLGKVKFISFQTTIDGEIFTSDPLMYKNIEDENELTKRFSSQLRNTKPIHKI